MKTAVGLCLPPIFDLNGIDYLPLFVIIEKTYFQYTKKLLNRNWVVFFVF